MKEDLIATISSLINTSVAWVASNAVFTVASSFARSFIFLSYAVHLQLVATVLFAGELENSGQLLQTEAPAREYILTAHATQAEAAAVEYLPAASQVLQTVDEDAPDNAL